jgi:hypothetical protein
MTTDAQKRATYNYRQRIKGTLQGEELRIKHNEYCKKAMKKLYENNDGYRLEKIKSGCDKNYYNNPDQVLRAIRKLFL